MTEPKEFSYPGIVERCYEFCAWLLPKISKFPKDQRYILGNRLQNGALDMLESFVDAAPASGQRKLIFLEEAQRRLEHVRLRSGNVIKEFVLFPTDSILDTS